MRRHEWGLGVRSVVAWLVALSAFPVAVATATLSVAVLVVIVLAVLVIAAGLGLQLYGTLPGEDPVIPELVRATPDWVFAEWVVTLAVPLAVTGGVIALAGAWLAVRAERQAMLADTRRPSGDERRVVDVVDRLTRQVDTSAPTVLVATVDEPVAFTVRLEGVPTLVVSEGLLELLDGDELEATLAHEVAHLVNGDVRAATVLSLLMHLISFLAFPAMLFTKLGNRGALVGLVFVILGLVQLVVVSLAGRIYFPARELVADAAAAEISGDPAALAAALERIHDEQPPESDLREETTVPAVLNVVGSRWQGSGWFQNDGPLLSATHPPLERRLEHLRRQARTTT